MNQSLPLKNCLICEKAIIRGRDWKAFERAKFCSRECYRVSLRGNKLREGTGKHKPKLCVTCGNQFKKGHRLPEQWKVAKYCSVACSIKSKIGIPRPDVAKRMIGNKNGRKLKGKNHPNWKGGVTPANHLLRHSEEYNEWRKAVYKRDGWTCQECKVKQEHPIAHHLKSFHEYPDLRFIVENGMTVCRSCHLKIHNQMKYQIA